MDVDAEDVREGIREGFEYWLSQHDVSTPECVTDGIKAAFSDWLEKNSDKIVEAIAKARRQ